MMATARPPSLAIDISDDVIVNPLDSPRSALAFEIGLGSQNSPIPKSLEKRLVERCEGNKSWSNEEIDQKLILAEMRRKEFLDWLSNKAKPKQKGPSPVPLSSEELAAKLEARLSAAEAKRTELLAKDQDRLAAYFASHEKRLARRQGTAERRWAATWQRLVKAEQRREALLEAERVKASERCSQARDIARSVIQARDQDARALQEKLQEKLVRASRRRQQLQQERGSLVSKRRASQGDKLSKNLARHWKAFRQQNKTTAQLAEDFQACNVSEATAAKLPFERFAGAITSARTVKAAKDLLARLETRLLLSNGKPKGTTVEHLLLRLSEASRPKRSPSPSPSSSPRVRSHPSPMTRRQPGVNSPAVQAYPSPRQGGVNSPHQSASAPTERYPARVFLCAFMILGHQEAVFNERGPREAALTEASKQLIPLFEELVTTIIERNTESPGSSPRESYDGHPLSPSPRRKRFADQLKDFDSAWLHYLDQFVAWKVKDLSSLEGDLIKVALQLESSMHQYCKAMNGEDAPHLSPDQEAIRVQVSTDQDLLRERINRLTGEEGLARMEQALETLRIRFIQQRNEAQSREALGVPVEIVQVDALGNRIAENDVSKGSPVVGGLSAAFSAKRGQSAQADSSPQRASPFDLRFPKPTPLKVPEDESDSGLDAGSSRKTPAARKLFDGNQATNQEGYAPLFNLEKGLSPAAANRNAPAVQSVGSAASVSRKHQGLENIHMVHELLYDPNWQLSVNEPYTNDSVSDLNPISDIQKRLGVAMERAFWDSIKEGLSLTPPDWTRVVGLVAEIRSELESLVPNKWQEELTEKMDVDLLRQVLESSPEVDFKHLLGLLHYAAELMIRLGAPARDQEAKSSLQALLADMTSPGTDWSQAPDVVTRGLRYLFERLRVLKRDVSNARLRALASHMAGDAGVEYERRWFLERYPNLTREPHMAIPRTATWLAEVGNDVNQVKRDHEAAVQAVLAAGLPSPAAVSLPAMRTGLARSPLPKPLGQVSDNPGSETTENLDWDSPSTLVKLGVLGFAPLTKGVTEHSLPETLQLDVGRVLQLQNDYQQILVIVTGLLLTRQVLASKGYHSEAELEGAIESVRKRLANLLGNPRVNLTQVGKLLAEAVFEMLDPERRAEWEKVGAAQMTSLMTKSTRAADAIFVLVGKGLVSALRGSVLAGASTPLGKALATAALRRAGAVCVVEDVLALAMKISRASVINFKVHKEWYSSLVVDEI